MTIAEYIAAALYVLGAYVSYADCVFMERQYKMKFAFKWFAAVAWPVFAVSHAIAEAITTDE